MTPLVPAPTSADMPPVYADLWQKKTAPLERLDHALLLLVATKTAIAIFTAMDAASYLATTF